MQLSCFSQIVRCNFHLLEQTIWHAGCFCMTVVPRGVTFGCGDLIFSSHMISTLVFIVTYQKYESIRFIKVLAWCISVAQSLRIVVSRKHYSVDLVVACWINVPLL